MAIQPLGDRILIKHLAVEEKSSGGIILPDSAQEKPQEGEIVAIGKGRILEDGTVKPLEVKKGDKVLFTKYSGTEVKYKDSEFLILREDDVLAVKTDK